MLNDFFKGINLNDQKQYLPLVLYKELLAEINNYPPVQIVDISALIQILTVTYIYLKLMQDVGNADPKLIEKLRKRVDEKLQEALGKGLDTDFGKGRKE